MRFPWAELENAVEVLKVKSSVLVCAWFPELYVLVIVRSSAGGAETIHVVPHIVIAELADLEILSEDLPR